MKRAKRSELSAPICSADFVMPFGKYRGQTLYLIADNDPSYIMWLADENVLQIEREFLDAVRMDDMEQDYGKYDGIVDD